MNRKIKWGIIGLGKIAHKFAADLQLSESAILQGVASRDLKKAKKFSTDYDSMKYYGSYQDLIKDPEIDIVYIATPHVFHFENTMMCLKNRKAVLCEKPMGINAEEVALMVKEARARNLFLMEGLWTRFIPATEKLLDILAQKQIGEVELVTADFGFKAEINPETRLYNKNLGGGSLLDIGIYPIYLSLLAMGMPSSLKANAKMTDDGVDISCVMTLHYENKGVAKLESTIEEDTPIEGFIQGSQGSIKLHNRFHHTERLTLVQNGKEEVIDLKYKGYGYFHEIEEVNNCLVEGQTESTKLPLQTSLDLMKIIEGVKREIGLEYKSRMLNINMKKVTNER